MTAVDDMLHGWDVMETEKWPTDWSHYGNKNFLFFTCCEPKTEINGSLFVRKASHGEESLEFTLGAHVFRRNRKLEGSYGHLFFSVDSTRVAKLLEYTYNTLTEIAILEKVSHELMAPVCHDIFQTRDVPYGKSLGFVCDMLSPIIASREVLCDMCMQIAHSLKHLQEKYKFIHGDLKHDNIMCTSDSSTKSGYRFLMIDFGFAAMCDNGEWTSTATFYSPHMYAKCVFPNSADLSLLTISVIKCSKFKEHTNRIDEILIWPGETRPIIDVYNWKTCQEAIYQICFQCHNPHFTPECFIEKIEKMFA